MEMLHSCQSEEYDNWEEKCVMDSEVIWVLGIFFQLVWKIVICKKKKLKLEVPKSEFALNMATLAYIVSLLD